MALMRTGSSIAGIEKTVGLDLLERAVLVVGDDRAQKLLEGEAGLGDVSVGDALPHLSPARTIHQSVPTTALSARRSSSTSAPEPVWRRERSRP